MRSAISVKRLGTPFHFCNICQRNLSVRALPHNLLLFIVMKLSLPAYNFVGGGGRGLPILTMSLGQGKRLSPISTFFSLVSSRASRDAPHSRFRCGDPNQCIPNFLKMPLLALPQIYTRVFHLWKFIDWGSAWVRDSRPFQLSFLS